MEIVRVRDQIPYQAGVHYVRIAATNQPLGASLPLEFEDDQADSRYILVLEGIQPVATCRIRQRADGHGQIERVATVPAFEGQGYGHQAVLAGEAWLRDLGISKVYINSRRAVEGFYAKLGYQADESQVTGEGNFVCVLMDKNI